MTITGGRLPDVPSAGADQLAVRRHNLAVVLRHLRGSGPRSRARVAAETGLNKATVSSLVAELAERGLVRDGEAERGSVGRPGQTVVLDGRGVCGIGAEVNVDYVAVMALDLRGDVVSERRLSLDTAGLGPAGSLDELARLVAEATDEVSARGGQPVGITLAVPGLVETATGRLSTAPNLGWQDVPVVAEMQARLGRPPSPVTVDNEANLAAIAETTTGEWAGTADLVLLTGAAGVGGGVVSGGRLLRGGQGFSGEVGHMPVDPAGRRCGCGRTGCWETVVGLSALLVDLADPDDPVRDPSLDLDGRLAEINRRAALGDSRTIAALEQVGSWLGVGASILVNVLNPAVLVLGGYLAAVGTWLREPLEAELRARVIAPGAGGCRVELSTLGFTAAVRGGAQVSLESVFRDPTLVHRVEPVGSPLPAGGPA
ncbi:MAG TPA: ROK family transcriptional regulator [Jiangellales bacterium]|nr:ROK family transcriptional regulator [Jiangellales bacterium]